MTYSGFSLCLFRTVEYISDKLNSYPLTSNCPHFKCPNYYFILRHNVPSYLTLTFANRVLLFYFPLKNMRVCTCPKKFFVQREWVKLLSEMLLLFSFGTFLTNYDITNRKHLIDSIYSIVQKQTIWGQSGSMETI